MWKIAPISLTDGLKRYDVGMEVAITCDEDKTMLGTVVGITEHAVFLGCDGEAITGIPVNKITEVTLRSEWVKANGL